MLRVTGRYGDPLACASTATNGHVNVLRLVAEPLVALVHPAGGRFTGGVSKAGVTRRRQCNRTIAALAAGTAISISPLFTRTGSAAPGAHLPNMLTCVPPNRTPSLLESDGAVRRMTSAFATPGQDTRTEASRPPSLFTSVSQMSPRSERTAYAVIFRPAGSSASLTRSPSLANRN